MKKLEAREAKEKNKKKVVIQVTPDVSAPLPSPSVQKTIAVVNAFNFESGVAARSRAMTMDTLTREVYISLSFVLSEGKIFLEIFRLRNKNV
jgi:hypothetical protein